MSRMIVAGIVAWALGLAAYELNLRLRWHQSMGGDWQAVALWSAIALAVVAPILYLPAMLLVRKLLGGYKPALWFPLIASALGVVPVALIVLFNGGRFADLLSAEASVFYSMFAIVGGVFGCAYAWRRRTAA